MKGCSYAHNQRELKDEGETVVLHDPIGDKRNVYAASIKDRRQGRSRTAVCVRSGDQVDVPLSQTLQHELGLQQETVRCTFAGHMHGVDDYFTVNGLEGKKIFLPDLVGAEMQVFPRGTEAISTIRPVEKSVLDAEFVEETPIKKTVPATRAVVANRTSRAAVAAV